MFLDAIKGVETAMSEMGLKEGTDFTLKKYCTQADMSQFVQIMDEVGMDPPDALITVSTPVFIAAVKRNFDFFRPNVCRLNKSIYLCIPN